MGLELAALDGRLQLRGLLGEGGMGQVYRAWDGALERAVAVKLVRSQLLAGDAQSARRSLERAVAVNTLIRGNPAYRAATAELGSP